MSETVKKRKVVNFSAKVTSSHMSAEDSSVNDHLLQAVITASKQDEQFKTDLLNILQGSQEEKTV